MKSLIFLVPVISLIYINLNEITGELSENPGGCSKFKMLNYQHYLILINYFIKVHQWKSYDELNDPSAPLEYGILIGYYHDESPGYAGKFTLNKSQYSYPAFVNFNGTRSEGVYAFNSKMIVDDEFDGYGHYLLNNENYTYEWVTYNVGDIFLNNVSTSTKKSLLPFVRINLTTNDRHEYTTLGMLDFNKTTTYYDPNSSSDDFFHTGFSVVEILTCRTNEPQLKSFEIRLGNDAQQKRMR